MPTDDVAPLPRQCVDRTPRQRAHETDTHPATVRALARRSRGQGMVGLLKDRRLPPIPIEVLGTAKGRHHTPEELARAFAQAVFPPTTNQ